MSTQTKAPEAKTQKGDKPQTYGNYINGRQVKSETGETFPCYNPANRDEVIGHFASSSPKDVKAAVDAAAKALPGWKATPAPHRAEIILKAAHLLETRKEELAQTMVREMGKVLKEARGDVQEAIDMAKYMAGEGRRLVGQTVPSELPNKFAMSIRQPIGVVGLITPWNFPLHQVVLKVGGALAAGCTVVDQFALELRDTTGGRNLLEIGNEPDIAWCAQLDALPTNAELATALAAADDAVREAIENIAAATGRPVYVLLGQRTPCTLVEEVLALGPGSVIELNKLAGEPVDVLVNDRLIARGEVVVVDENFGVRVTEVISPRSRAAAFAR